MSEGTARAASTGRAATMGRAATRPLFVGTYTDGAGAGTGIGVATWDTGSGQITLNSTVTVSNPSFLALSPSRDYLYSVDEQTGGEVTALSLGGSAPKVINSQSSEGDGPTHLCVHPSGEYVLAANYDSGSVVVLPVRADGGLSAASDLAQHTGSGPDPDRQQGPHAHQVLPDTAGGHLHSVDLGTDSVYVYRLNLATGTLSLKHQVKLAPGTGPRHMAFHPDGRHAYIVNELGNSVIVAGYDHDTGLLSPGQPQTTLTAPVPGGVRNYPAEVVVSADGRFVYVSNRGADNVALFAVDSGGAALRLLSTTPVGKYPRHIALSPDGDFLFSANQNSATVTSYQVDRASGALTPVDTALATPVPVMTLPL